MCLVSKAHGRRVDDTAIVKLLPTQECQEIGAYLEPYNAKEDQQIRDIVGKPKIEAERGPNLFPSC
jgi:hypothetical protein